MPQVCYHATSLLPCHESATTPWVCYHATSLLPRHESATMPRVCYHATILLPCHESATMLRVCYHAMSLLPCHESATLPRVCYHATSLLPCHESVTMPWFCYHQGLTKTWLKRGQMALGVFPNCHECQKIDFPVLKKCLRLFTSWPKTHGVLEIPRTSGASGCITSYRF